MFSISSSSPAVVRLAVPLNAMCSRKCAVPLFAAVSYRDPASIQTPTVAVSAFGVVSVATRMPLASVVTCALFVLFWDRDVYVWLVYRLCITIQRGEGLFSMARRSGRLDRSGRRVASARG